MDYEAHRDCFVEMVDPEGPFVKFYDSYMHESPVHEIVVDGNSLNGLNGPDEFNVRTFLVKPPADRNMLVTISNDIDLSARPFLTICFHRFHCMPPNHRGHLWRFENKWRDMLLAETISYDSYGRPSQQYSTRLYDVTGIDGPWWQWLSDVMEKIKSDMVDAQKDFESRRKLFLDHLS